MTRTSAFPRRRPARVPQLPDALCSVQNHWPQRRQRPPQLLRPRPQQHLPRTRRHPTAIGWGAASVLLLLLRFCALCTGQGGFGGLPASTQSVAGWSGGG